MALKLRGAGPMVPDDTSIPFGQSALCGDLQRDDDGILRQRCTASITVQIATARYALRRGLFTREQLPSLPAAAGQRLRQDGPPAASGNRSDPRDVASDQGARQRVARLLGTATP